MLDEDLRKVVRACGFQSVNENLRDDLEKIISWQDILKEVDIRSIEPMYNTLEEDAIAIVNEDIACEKHDDIFFNAPDIEDNFFLVPKVIDRK